MKKKSNTSKSRKKSISPSRKAAKKKPAKGKAKTKKKTTSTKTPTAKAKGKKPCRKKATKGKTPTKKAAGKKAPTTQTPRKPAVKRNSSRKPQKKTTKKAAIKSTKKKTAKKPSRKKTAKGRGTTRRKPKTRKSASGSPKKKAAKRKTAKKISKKKPAKKSVRKPSKGKTTKKPPKKKSSKKAKVKRSAAKSAVRKAVAKRGSSIDSPKKQTKPKAKKAASPEIKERKPGMPERKPLNKGEISRLLSDAYARHVLIEAGGEHALEIVRGFSNNISDEEISKKLKIKISDVRATLNKLHSLGIVDYSRYKDSETGWFSYFWCLNVVRMKTWVNERVEEELRNFDFSNGEYYFCPSCGGASIHDFVSASDYGFRCPACSSSLDFLSDEKAQNLFPTMTLRKPRL